MITSQRIVELVEAAIPGARATARDLTGTADHYEVVVVAQAFAGASTLERHRRVYASLVEPLKGPLHALTLTTLTPDEASKKGA
jgi:stress-induced morphogen